MRRFALLVFLGAACTALVVLGSWQLKRRAWKLDLIERVEEKLGAAPVAAPGPASWLGIGKTDEYRRLTVSGTFRHDLETCTQAVTVRGPGCWVLTPLQTAAGWWLLVNRGFVDQEHRAPGTRMDGQSQGTVTVSGLLRLSEPDGGFLRANDPTRERWTSRDVSAIALNRRLPMEGVAPYFLDADSTAPGGPTGGLSVVRFHNPHLAYALTWFGLATLAASGVVIVIRRRPTDGEPDIA